MIHLKLISQHFNYLNTEYDIVQIKQDNYKEHMSLIETSIRYFNDEITWNDMFNEQESIDRFNKGMIMYIGKIKDDPFGHVWFNGTYLFNLFVRNKVDVKTYTGKEFLSDIIQKYYKRRSITCDVDVWNEKSLKLFDRLGFKSISLQEK